MDRLLDGVARFQRDVFPNQRTFFAGLADGQAPHALFITCSDSRIVPNLITQTQPGELVICRDVGNIVPPHGAVYGAASATVEYSVSVLGVSDVIVCGHSDCGAMRALLEPAELAELPSAQGWLRYAEAAVRVVLERHGSAPPAELLDALVRQNVVMQLANLRTHPCIAVGLAAGTLRLNGWHYDIESGTVSIHDEATGAFVPAVTPT